LPVSQWHTAQASGTRIVISRSSSDAARIEPGRRGFLQAGLVLGLSLSLEARACEFFAANLTIIHPWARASGAADDAAIVCMTFQDVTHADRLIGVSTPVAQTAEMSGDGAARGVDLLIPAGQTTVLSEAGAHLRLLGLKFPLQLGRQYPLSFEFDRAGIVQAQLTIDYARFG
jgi:copper(I)-binding protein